MLNHLSLREYFIPPIELFNNKVSLWILFVSWQCNNILMRICYFNISLTLSSFARSYLQWFKDELNSPDIILQTNRSKWKQFRVFYAKLIFFIDSKREEKKKNREITELNGWNSHEIFFIVPINGLKRGIKLLITIVHHRTLTRHGVTILEANYT